ncbi:hypothetical protein SLEP1_g162 [Rubroshorea leprosula]|uniref:Always early n=1 Tax=Rubroshorea leprosula TaxID=152421 RepID=A0AAV5H9E8_9ROSI|nr:hypothetical protein SLEP1_g162 [Rubroshorea leprosula]
MLGPQWSKEELERFYEAYRRNGKDWKKVAASVRNRTVEMVEALYSMNRAYLSLPEGTASVVGLIAMMTDHYSVLEGSDSEQESNEGVEASRKPQKRGRGTVRDQSSRGSDGSYTDLLQFHSAAANYGCLSLLKKKRSGSRPRAVGKRTPRIPVSYSYEKDRGERYNSPIRQGFRLKVDTVDDDVAHEIALALAEASQRGGSPQVSRTPNRKPETPSPVQNVERMCAESEMTSAKLHGSEMDEDGCELSLGSTEADNGDYAGVRNYSMDVEETKEACSGTEEGQKLGKFKEKYEVGAADVKISQAAVRDTRKRSKKVLFGGDEDASFDALQTLADLSLMMPDTTADNESSVHFKEEKSEVVEKIKLKGNHSIAGAKATAVKTSKLGRLFDHDVTAVPETKEETHQINIGMRRRRQKGSPFKIPEDETHPDSHLVKYPKVKATDEVKKPVSKGKRSHNAAYPKQEKLVRPPERASSSNDQGSELNNLTPSTILVPVNKVNLPTKVRSKRKIDAQKIVIEKDIKSEDIVNGKSNIPSPSLHEKSLNLKEKVSKFLSSYQARKWCVFEWFYSAIDYPWFAKREFVEYLDHVGLGHVPRLTRVEWGVIRSSLGKPRRFSEQFLKEEREKLNQYRESVRNHYAELRSGVREGLPTDLARPLSVGQCVIAVHPKTQEIHDGCVLTIDRSRYKIQFDCPELEVEFVMDTDCMPLNPLENMPASLARQNVVFGKFIENFNELKMNGVAKERKVEESTKFSLCQNLESTNSPSCISPSTNHVSKLLQQAKVDSPSPNLQPKVGPGESVYTQQVVNSQPYVLAQIQAREADVQALSELTRALHKKEAVVSELRHMNDEVLENQKGGDNSLKDSDSFKKQYAAVLLQLNEINEQVSCALFCLRQRNTYHESASPLWLKPSAITSEHGGHLSSLDHPTYHTQESVSHVAEIVESSRTKAKSMVHAAIQAISSLRKGGKVIERIEDAIDFVNNQISVDDSSMAAVRSSVNSNLASHDHLTGRTPSPLETSTAPDLKLDELSDQDEAQIPLDLIAHCVATLLMIQKCTERQFPPGDVAQVLDSAVTSLQPYCSQNLPIYAEIQKCMGIIRNQILALVPT